jgi:DNA-binding NarL/FixJ family response regulator
MLKTYLVEDSPVIRQSLISTLEELSAVTVVASADNESSAIAWLSEASNKVALVIIDIFLKSGSGLGVLRRANDLGLDSKLVVLTNYATTDMRQKCLALGAARVFDKSNDIDALIIYCNKLAAGEPDTTAPGFLQ